MQYPRPITRESAPNGVRQLLQKGSGVMITVMITVMTHCEQKQLRMPCAAHLEEELLAWFASHSAQRSAFSSFLVFLISTGAPVSV